MAVTSGPSPAAMVTALCSEVEEAAASASELPLDPVFRTDANNIPHIVNGPRMISALCGIHTKRPVTTSRSTPCSTCVEIATERLSA